MRPSSKRSQFQLSWVYAHHWITFNARKDSWHTFVAVPRGEGQSVPLSWVTAHEWAIFNDRRETWEASVARALESLELGQGVIKRHAPLPLPRALHAGFLYDSFSLMSLQMMSHPMHRAVNFPPLYQLGDVSFGESLSVYIWN